MDGLIRMALNGGYQNLHHPEPRENLQSLVAYYARKCTDPAKDQDKADLLTLRGLCDQAWTKKRNNCISASADANDSDSDSDSGSGSEPELEVPAATELLKALVRMQDWAYYDKALGTIKGLFDIEKLFSWIKSMTDDNDGNATLTFSEAQQPLLRAILSLRVPAHIILGLRCFLPTPPEPGSETKHITRADYEEWARTALVACLDSLDSYTLRYVDGSVLVNHCNDHYGFEYLESQYVI
jgi:hypothetical protein